MPFSNVLANQFKPLLFVLVLSVFGFVVNLYPLPLVANIHLIIGNMAFVIVAMRLGVFYSLLSAIIVVSGLYLSFNHPFVYISFCLEAVCLALLRKRGMYVLYADILYWLLIGIPVTALLLHLAYDSSWQTMLFTIIKQGINGLFYAGLAGLVVYFWPNLFTLTGRQQPVVIRTLHQKLVYAAVLLISFTVIITSMLVTQSLVNRQHSELEEDLVNSRNYIALSANNLLKSHALAFTHADAYMQTIAADDWQQARAYAQRMQDNYPLFYDVMLVNQQQQTVYATSNSLVSYTSDQQAGKHAFSTLFNKALNSFEVVVEVVPNQVDNNQPLLLFSKAFSFDQSATPDGVLMAAINLQSISQMWTEHTKKSHKVLLLDAEDQVLFSSDQSLYPSLTTFFYRQQKDITFDEQSDIKLVELYEQGIDVNTRFYLTHRHLQNGWQVVVIQPSQQVTSSVEQEYLLILKLLFGTLVISILFANIVARQITKPLTFIGKQLTQTEQRKDYQLNATVPSTTTEIVDLYQQFKHFYSRRSATLELTQSELDDTKAQLTLADDKIAELTLTDPVTKIANRKAFEGQFSVVQKLTQRNHNNLACVLIELDKAMFASTASEQSSAEQRLRDIAHYISDEFAREGDLTARFSELQFVVAISHINEHHLARKLDKLVSRMVESGQQASQLTDASSAVQIGAVIAPAAYSSDVTSWLKLADLALYKAKQSAGDNVHIESMLGIV
ncbi:diguanylate cyclase [Thalassotalea ponticola]|uniref:diguanylate cyclase domain-containing protein n=1 Tax=Thalassotalea ponticola TaxID=1523392 RepID=UPI0025B4B760|nr:diguanylate cyclase [Thalassotalea ponticola]MDN3652055.1 diguanylate cyclase [Thalassotalea ponticola]